MSAYMTDKNASNQSGGSISTNYYGTSISEARVVEVTVEESFDENGKLYSRTTKTVTTYENKPTYHQWYAAQGATPAYRLT